MRKRCDDGYVTVLLPFLLAFASFATIVVLDLTAYFAAGVSAQTAADMAALAAAAPQRGAFGDAPRLRAEQVASGYGATVTRCVCHLSDATVTVEVTVPVHARALPRLGGAQHVAAVAHATLAPP